MCHLYIAGNNGVHGCYCSIEEFPNETGQCSGGSGHTFNTCNIPGNDVCPGLDIGNGTCAIAVITSPDMKNCTDCYNIGGMHRLHYACFNPSTKECHVTENECKTHSPPCGDIPGWCPCPQGWETCYST